MMLFALLPVFAALLVVRAGRKVDDQFVGEWAGAHDLALTDGTRPVVRSYLRNAAMLRMLGVLAGIVIPLLAEWAFGRRDLNFKFPDDLGWVFAGYLVGALYAEITLVRRGTSEKRTASLAPRTLDAYAPSGLFIAQMALGLTGLLGSVAVAAFDLSKGDGAPNGATVIALGLAAFVVALALYRIERRIVERPQPATAPDALEADNAIRAQSVHSVASSGVAVLLLLVSRIGAAATHSDIAALNRALELPVALLPIVALGVCLFFGHRRWPVRRVGIETAVAG